MRSHYRRLATLRWTDTARQRARSRHFKRIRRLFARLAGRFADRGVHRDGRYAYSASGIPTARGGLHFSLEEVKQRAMTKPSGSTASPAAIPMEDLAPRRGRDAISGTTTSRRTTTTLISPHGRKPQGGGLSGTILSLP